MILVRFSSIKRCKGGSLHNDRFIILIFPQITKNRYKQTSQSIYKLLTRQRASQKLRLVAEGQDDAVSVASMSTLDEILKSNLLLNKPRSIRGDVRLDDMINTPRISEGDEMEEDDMPGMNDLNKGEPTRDLKATRDENTRENMCDVGVETQREMAKVTLECGLQVGGYDVDAQTYIGSDFWDDLDKVKYSTEDMVPHDPVEESSPIPILHHISIPILKVSATTPIQTDDVLSIPDYLGQADTSLDATQSVIMEGDEGPTQSVILEGDEEEEEVKARIIADDEDTLSSSSSSSRRDRFFSSSSSSSSSSDDEKKKKKKNKNKEDKQKKKKKKKTSVSSLNSDDDDDKKKKKKDKKKKKIRDSEISSLSGGDSEEDKDKLNEFGVRVKKENAVYSKGHVVLARWEDEGWYFRGKIVSPTKEGYIVEDNAGNREDIDTKHILLDEQVCQ